MMRTTTSWRRNFKRWSVQAAAAGALLGGLEALGHAAQAAQTTLPLWEPILPPWAFALVSTLLSVTVIVVRNLPQEGNGDEVAEASVGRADGPADRTGRGTRGPAREGQEPSVPVRDAGGSRRGGDTAAEDSGSRQCGGEGGR